MPGLVFTALPVYGPSRQVEIVWNVLELDWEGASAALGSRDLLESFCEFLHMALVDGYREKDRMLRNDLMVLLSILTRRPEARVGVVLRVSSCESHM